MSSVRLPRIHTSTQGETTLAKVTQGKLIITLGKDNVTHGKLNQATVIQGKEKVTQGKVNLGIITMVRCDLACVVIYECLGCNCALKILPG